MEVFSSFLFWQAHEPKRKQQGKQVQAAESGTQSMPLINPPPGTFDATLNLLRNRTADVSTMRYMLALLATAFFAVVIALGLVARADKLS